MRGTQGLIVNVLSLVVWKCGNVEMWKCRNMRVTQGLIVNVLSLVVWKCGNLEMWKSGNLEICVELRV